MIVESSGRYSSPFGTGMDSNAVYGGFTCEDAHPADRSRANAATLR
jgi:hypothetical protein